MVAIPTGSLLHQEYHKALFLAHFFSYYIDDLQSVVCYSTLKLFADDVAVYREIKVLLTVCYYRKILITSIRGQLSSSYV